MSTLTGVMTSISRRAIAATILACAFETLSVSGRVSRPVELRFAKAEPAIALIERPKDGIGCAAHS
jgi:hypothetical protein